MIKHLDCFNHIAIFDRIKQVITSQNSSNLYPVTAGVPQGAIWSPPLFNLYIPQLPNVVKHSIANCGIC